MVGVQHRSSRSPRESAKSDSGPVLLRRAPFAHILVLVLYVRSDTGRGRFTALPYPGGSEHVSWKGKWPWLQAAGQKDPSGQSRFASAWWHPSLGMPCYHPQQGYRTLDGAYHMGRAISDSIPMRFPCGCCIGCIKAHAKAWALRCTLELQQHRSATFTTLTYDQANLPASLSRRDLQLFIKRLRKALADGDGRSLRFFACGEYGGVTERPHYHAILYGLSEGDRDLVSATWGMGRTSTDNVTPRSIAYTAGYTDKKAGKRFRLLADGRNETFLQMSRRPGIGGEARKYINSWKYFAVNNGFKTAVPRYLHQAWKDQATPLQQERLLFQKAQLAAQRDTSVERLEAAEAIAYSRHSLSSQRRHL